MNKKHLVQLGAIALLAGMLIITIGVAVYFYFSYQELNQAYKENLTYYINKTAYLENENRWL
ncbi:MAG: hypothetical protein GXN92_02220, partial [Candidatus Micrarchaeota archaeon]|nr:hypothetical protein [Candidatus Micrarchaeota archaeon]